MRKICILVLLILLVGIGAFALQNNEAVTIRFFNQTLSCPCSLVVVAVYLLGTASGWLVVALVRNSLRRSDY